VEEKVERKGDERKRRKRDRERDRETEREKRDPLALTTSRSEAIVVRFYFRRIIFFILRAANSETPFTSAPQRVN